MSKYNWTKAQFTVVTGDTFNTITVKGRDRWALECLIAARSNGCTPIDTPGPRWSAYVHRLRDLGVSIQTINAPHKGDFPGTHARYVLRSNVTLIQDPKAA